MRFVWIVAVIIGIGAGFGGGFLTATKLSEAARQDAVRRDLLKQLIAAKASIESGLSLADLRASEKHVRAELDLVSTRLTDRQKPAAIQALDAISQTVAAWDETFTRCHSADEAVALLGNGDCNNKTFERIFQNMNVLPEFMKFTKNYSIWSPPKRSSFLQPLFRVSLDRMQTAIDTLR